MNYKDKANVIKEYGDIPRIQCYPNELNQAFMNLFSNAIGNNFCNGFAHTATSREQSFATGGSGEGMRSEG